MKIPIENVYYLLCYAWDKLEEREVVHVDPLESTTLADLFARVLANGTEHLVKRGFDRGYISEEEWTARPRGRIRIEEAIRRGRTRMGTLPCHFDELSHNVLHNRILKITMLRLIRSTDLARPTSDRLTQICHRLSDVEEIRLNERIFGLVQLHRNNQFYDFLLKVCELIFANLLVSEKSGSSKFKDFVQDERQMRILFQRFVRNFYRIHTTYQVKGEDIRWRWIPADRVAGELLPKMQTDVTLISENRRIIIECKFTPTATQRHHEAETLRSGHLYQIHAYISNLQGRLADSCEVLLLYPAAGPEIKALYTYLGHKISVRSINLDQPWQGIQRDLLALVA